MNGHVRCGDGMPTKLSTNSCTNIVICLQSCCKVTFKRTNCQQWSMSHKKTEDSVLSAIEKLTVSSGRCSLEQHVTIWR